MSSWIQQGFIGPRAAVDAARDALSTDPRLGGMLPAYGQPPQEVVPEPDGLWSFGIVVLAPSIRRPACGRSPTA